jgi:hypothetical protein
MPRRPTFGSAGGVIFNFAPGPSKMATPSAYLAVVATVAYRLRIKDRKLYTFKRRDRRIGLEGYPIASMIGVDHGRERTSA